MLYLLIIRLNNIGSLFLDANSRSNEAVAKLDFNSTPLSAYICRLSLSCRWTGSLNNLDLRRFLKVSNYAMADDKTQSCIHT